MEAEKRRGYCGYVEKAVDKRRLEGEKYGRSVILWITRMIVDRKKGTLDGAKEVRKHVLHLRRQYTSRVT